MRRQTLATEAVAAAGIEHQVVEYGKVADIEEAALKRGVPVEKVMKSLVVRTGDEFVMVIVPGDRVIDWPKLRAVVGRSRMALATTDEALEVTGVAGGGMVQVTLNGKGEAKHVKVDRTLVDPKEVEMLEDLIVAAFNDARAKVEAHIAEKMRELTGGLDLPPGMQLPF